MITPLLILLSQLLVIGVCIGLIIWTSSFVLNKAPFVPIFEKGIDDILAALHLTEKSVFYDLGSGDGRVVIAVAKAHPETHCVGIEIHPLPYFISLFKARRKLPPEASVTFIRGNFFKLNLGEATHIFTYLYPQVMEDLLPKLERELRPGAILVTCDFIFTKKQPLKIIPLDLNKWRCKQLVVYKF